MKTEMTNDEFTEFIAKVIFKMDNYNFDILYDVAKFMAEFKKYRGVTGHKVQMSYYLCVRSTGCDTVNLDDTSGLYEIYKGRSDQIYILNFCWNRDYFNVPFCIVEKIK